MVQSYSAVSTVCKKMQYVHSLLLVMNSLSWSFSRISLLPEIRRQTDRESERKREGERLIRIIVTSIKGCWENDYWHNNITQQDECSIHKWYSRLSKMTKLPYVLCHLHAFIVCIHEYQMNVGVDNFVVPGMVR